MAVHEAAPALDLSVLVERLRLSGFRIDTRQYLTAHELLLALAVTGVKLDGDPDRLITHVGPIFCTTAQEQDLFAEEVRHWFGQGPVALPGEHDAQVRGPGDTTSGLWRHWRLGLAAIAVVTALIAGWRWYAENVATVTAQGTVVLQLPDGRIEPLQATVLWDGESVAVDEGGRFVLRTTRNQLRTRLDRLRLDYSRLPSGTAETRLEGETLRVVVKLESLRSPVPDKTPFASVAVALPATRTETRVTPWTVVALGALAFAGVGWGILHLLDRTRRVLAIRRLPVHDEPELVTLRVPEAQVLPVSEAQLRRAAIALRRRRDESLVEIDVPSTIDATVRAAGFFIPRYSTRRATPEYLALVSRRGDNDHQARTFDAILDHLADLGVVLDRYSFHDDPRFVHSETSNRGYRLAEVVSKHHRATLLVCAESVAGFNQIAGHVASWVEATRPLVRRIYLTPEAPYRWTRFEFGLIEAGFIVLPATDSGWMALADLIMGSRLESFGSAPYARAYPPVLGTNELRWLDRNEPPPEIVQKLTRQLRGFLGPDGFAWLCSCAVYPEMTWPLTIRVAHEPPDYSVLPSLARLPWFRHGFMPDWLRRVLVDLLPPEDERRLRATLERLLEELSHHSTSRSQSSTSRLRIGRWIGPRDLLAGAAPGSPLRDHVFIGFMFGARRDPLWLQAPRLLARIFRREVGRFSMPDGDVSPPARSFRDRFMARVRWWFVFRPEAVRLALASGLGVVAFMALPPVMTQARVTTEQESISFVEIPSGEFTMGSDRSVDPAAQNNEQPQYLLYVPTFLIATTEVTVAQYSVCVKEGACEPGDRRALAGPVSWPVRYLSWSEALAYCRWLENGLKTWRGTPDLIAGVLSGRLDGRSWRVTLPSEPEWEKAARGYDGRIYPWGNQVERVRAIRQLDSASQAPVPVGANQSGASPYGLLDMGGNVAEWTRSLAQPYPYSTVDGRENLDPARGPRVIRGGSFDSSPDAEVRAARRLMTAASQRDAMIGFRVAISSLEPVGASNPDLTLARNNTSPPAAAPPRATPPKKAQAPPKANPPRVATPSATPKQGGPPTSGGGATSPPSQTTVPPSNLPGATPVPAQARRDEESIRLVLRELERAYAELDLNQIARIWPSRAEPFRAQMASLNGVKLTIAVSRIAVNGDRATASCQFNWEYDWKRATQAGRYSTGRTDLRLRRTSAGSWVIIGP